MASQLGSRLVFQNARNAVRRAGLSAEKAVLSQSYLRFEAPLSVTAQTYTFDVLVNEAINPLYVTQQKLNLQDSFVCSEIGIFLANPATAGVNASNFELYTYPNQVAFDATSDQAAYTIYNGYMQLTVNQRTIVTNWDTQRHYCVNQTQQLVTKAAVSPFNAIDQNNYAQDGFYPVEPNIVLVGSKKNLLQVVLPNALASVPASGNARLVFVMRGILAQNSTSVN
jgi:hypothetical protein